MLWRIKRLKSWNHYGKIISGTSCSILTLLNWNSPRTDLFHNILLKVLYISSNGLGAYFSKVTYFSNHKVRLVVCLIILRRLGELISLSSFVHTLPTSSDGCTALKKKKKKKVDACIKKCNHKHERRYYFSKASSFPGNLKLVFGTEFLRYHFCDLRLTTWLKWLVFLCFFSSM